MEPSKSISTIIAKLKIAYSYYFKELSNEEFIGLISMYQEELENYNDLTLTTAIKTIIRNNKFMPTLKEIIDECERCRTYNGNSILEKMRNDGYDIISGPRTTGDGYYESCIIGIEENQIEITV